MGGHDAELILIAGVLLAAGIAGALLADRMRIPGLLLFLGLGMLAGSEGIGGIEFDNAELARTLGTVALVLILFEGGLTSGWREIRPVLGTAASLATLGTLLTALIAGLAAKFIFDLTVLEGMLVGAAVAATDSAAIFAVLRRSTVEKRLARSLEGESGMNDPVALLLVIGFIEWIQQPGFGLADMAGLLALKLALGAAIGLGCGWLATRALERVPLPSDGIYPVATIAIAGLSYGIAEVAPRLRPPRRLPDRAGARHGADPGQAHRSTTFHEGLGWVSQISLFILLGLLVFPSEPGRRRRQGPGALGGADPARAAVGDLRRDRAVAVAGARAADAGLGRPARGDADLARDLPRRRRHPQRRRDLRDRLLRRRQLDPGPGGELRAAGAAARPDHRRAGAAAAAAGVGPDPRDGRRRRRLPAARGRRRGRATGCASSSCRARRWST